MDLCKIHLHSIVKLETAKKLTKVVKETEKEIYKTQVGKN